MYFLPSGPSTELAEDGSQLALDFRRDAAGQTFIAKQYAIIPITYARPNISTSSLRVWPSLHIQSCSGGLFEDDRLSFTIHAAEGTAVHLTTQASTIVHSARGPGFAKQQGQIVAQSGAFVEYLPDPIILSSRLTLYDKSLTMQLAESARLVIGKSFFLHDPAGIGASPAALDSCLEVRLSDGSLLARDRMKIDGEAWKACLPGCWGDWSYHGLLLVIGGSFPANFCAPRCALLPPRSMEFTPALRPCLTERARLRGFSPEMQCSSRMR